MGLFVSDMMFSSEKCGGAGSGPQSPVQIFKGNEGNAIVVADEIPSGASAGSDEIGDILKDELGDVERQDRIGVHLTELSIELGLLASYAEGDGQPDMPSLLDINVSIYFKCFISQNG